MDAGASAWGIDVGDEVVWDDEPYSAWLIGPTPPKDNLILFSAAGDEPLETHVHLENEIARLMGVPHEDGESCSRILLSEDMTLFGHVFGFARIEVSLTTEAGVTLDLMSREVTCLTRHTNTEREISGMLKALLDSPDDTVIRWMLAGAGKGDGEAIVDDGEHESTYSLANLVGRAEKVIRVFETHMSYLRSRAHAKIGRTTRRMGIEQVRTMGDREMRWLCQRGEPAPDLPSPTGPAYDDLTFLPRTIVTSVKIRCFDNYENRVLMALAMSVERTLAITERHLSDERREAERLRRRLAAFQESGYAMPALVVVELVLGRGASLMSRLNGARAAIRRILRQLTQTFVDVSVRNPTRVLAAPKRTKVFQEVRPYADIFRALIAWKTIEGFSLGRENLGLHALRTSKLYEYYALHELLASLYDLGYRADPSHATPFETARYSLAYRRYANERRVATVYHLASADDRITLYYQPVIYGSEREEYGIDLHRTTPVTPFAEAARRDAPYTPDYLIYYRHGTDPVRRIVLDAKFIRYDRLHTEGNPTVFMDCMRKYLLETMAEGGGRVDAVWLLSAIGDRTDCLCYEGSAWAQAQSTLVRSGIACVNPLASALPDLLAHCGIGTVAPVPHVTSVTQDMAAGTHETPAVPHQEREVESDAGQAPDICALESARHEGGLTVPMSDLIRMAPPKPQEEPRAADMSVEHDEIPEDDRAITSVEPVREVSDPPEEVTLPDTSEAATSAKEPALGEEPVREAPVPEAPPKRDSKRAGKKERKSKPKPKSPRTRTSQKRSTYDVCVRLLQGLFDTNEEFARRVTEQLDEMDGAIALRPGFFVLRRLPPNRGQARQYARTELGGTELYLLRIRSDSQMGMLRSVLMSGFGLSADDVAAPTGTDTLT